MNTRHQQKEEQEDKVLLHLRKAIQVIRALWGVDRGLNSNQNVMKSGGLVDTASGTQGQPARQAPRNWSATIHGKRGTAITPNTVHRSVYTEQAGLRVWYIFL